MAIHKVSDRTFLMHLGGKIEMKSKVPLRNRDDLSMAYTPGVARVSHGHRPQPRGRPPPDHQAATRSPWSTDGSGACWAWATSAPPPRCR